MRKARIELIIIALLLTVAALVALGREETPENILPSDGILLCEIEGEPYYYDTEYLFKITASVFPENPNADAKTRAVYYELAYREMIAEDAYVSVDRVEGEIKERRGIAKAAENILADSETEASQRAYYEEYMEMLTACAEKEGTSATVYWDDIAPYVEKGILIEMYIGKPLYGFGAEIEVPETEYKTLSEKYDVVFSEELW